MSRGVCVGRNGGVGQFVGVEERLKVLRNRFSLFRVIVVHMNGLRLPINWRGSRVVVDIT